MNITIIGSGYVGLVVSTYFSYYNNNVCLFDINKDKINDLLKRKAPIYEPELEKFLFNNKISFTYDSKEAFNNPNVIFICVQTLTKKNNEVDLSYVYKACDSIIKNSSNEKIIVVIKSTVPVGTCEKIEKYFKNNKKNNIYVVSSPEFLAQGTAIHDIFNPSRVIVGANNDYSYGVMRKLYSHYKGPYIETSYRSSEMIKYVANSFLATKISFVNEMANMCEKLDINCEEVMNGIKYDPRIGDKYFDFGIGFGGSCLNKDTKALKQLAKNNNVKANILNEVIKVNNSQNVILFNKLKKDLVSLSNQNIGVLGITFKKNTDDVRNSPSIKNINLLLKSKANVRVFDTIGIEKIKKIYNDKITYFENIESFLTNLDAVMLLNDNDIIKNIDISLFEKLMKKANIYDGRKCLNIKEVSKYKVNYISIGMKSILNIKEELNEKNSN